MVELRVRRMAQAVGVRPVRRPGRSRRSLLQRVCLGAKTSVTLLSLLRWVIRNRAWTPFYLVRYWRFAVLKLRHRDVITEGFVLLGKHVDIDVRPGYGDRKSTRLNSSHVASSYAVFCLKNKTQATHY